MTDEKVNKSLIQEYSARAASWDNVPAIVGLRNASSQSRRGTDVTGVHWQKRSIGRALTLQALNSFHERGTRQVMADTDGESQTKAYRMYQKSGMEIFLREYVYEKTICPGHDYVKRNLMGASQVNL